jgi:hypothetical protein
MKSLTRVYVSRIGIGDRKRCVELAMRDLKPPIQKLVDAKEIESAVMQVYYSAEQLAEETLPVAPIVKATGGVFPVVWVAIGQTPPRPSQGLAQLEKDYQLELTETFSPMHP